MVYSATQDQIVAEHFRANNKLQRKETKELLAVQANKKQQSANAQFSCGLDDIKLEFPRAERPPINQWKPATSAIEAQLKTMAFANRLDMLMKIEEQSTRNAYKKQK